MDPKNVKYVHISDKPKPNSERLYCFIDISDRKHFNVPNKWQRGKEIEQVL